MTKPDWCPQWAWDTAERHLRPDQFGIMQPAQVLLARVAIEAERRAEERNAETIRRLQDKGSQMAMDWTKAMTEAERRGMERAAKVAETGYWSSALGDHVPNAIAAAIRRVVEKEIDP